MDALDCKRLVISVCSCKNFNVQHLFYPKILGRHLLRVGKTLWQGKCPLAVNRLTVLVCNRYLSIGEWHTPTKILSNLLSSGPVTLTQAAHMHQPHQNFNIHACT